MIIDCISDLHGEFPELEGGDLLIIAGDCTSNDSVAAWNYFFDMVERQDYKHKVMIAGNHDNSCKQWVTSDDSIYDLIEDKPFISYLCDSEIEIEGLKIWGSPWSNWFPQVNPHCKAFMATEQELAKKWAMIPSDTDILVTHGPPFEVLDWVRRYDTGMTDYTGSFSLKDHVIRRVKPKIHVFGHIHEHGGQIVKDRGITFVNASIMNERYEPVNKPVRIIL